MSRGGGSSLPPGRAVSASSKGVAAVGRKGWGIRNKVLAR